MSKIEQITALLNADDLHKQVETKARLLAMPLITFPEEYGILVGQGKSAAYATKDSDPTFPGTILVGRQRFMRTAALVDWLMSKEETAQLLHVPKES
jgi:hypothetical protein